MNTLADWVYMAVVSRRRREQVYRIPTMSTTIANPEKTVAFSDKRVSLHMASTENSRALSNKSRWQNINVLTRLADQSITDGTVPQKSTTTVGRARQLSSSAIRQCFVRTRPVDLPNAASQPSQRRL